jgi:hypothetical protein
MRLGRWVALCLPLLLTGCVTVDVSVNSRGKVTQEITLIVPQRSADGMRNIFQRYLGQDWSVRILEGKGEQRTIYARRAVKADPQAKLMPGLTVQFRRRNHWFRATYEATFRYDPTELLQTPEEKRLASNQQVTVRVRMPGRVLTEKSSVTSAEGNRVELTLDPLQPTEVRITALGILWWRIVLLLLILAFLLWLVAPYVPRLLQAFPRRTVRVVQR